jgi:hypothetical protein
VTNLICAMKVKRCNWVTRGVNATVRERATSAGLVRGATLNGAEQEHICWDPKDGELYLNRMNPEETLVEVRHDSDVQIDR